MKRVPIWQAAVLAGFMWLVALYVGRHSERRLQAKQAAEPAGETPETWVWNEPKGECSMGAPPLGAWRIDAAGAHFVFLPSVTPGGAFGPCEWAPYTIPADAAIDPVRAVVVLPKRYNTMAAAYTITASGRAVPVLHLAPPSARVPQ